MNLQEIELRRTAMGTIVNITSVFEGLASMRISQVKNQVLQSQQFFNELWHIYRQLRVDSLFRFGREQRDRIIDKQLYIIITGEGGFSGDIDQKLISTMLKTYNSQNQDIIVIGHHGAMQLHQLNVDFKKYFTLPAKDSNINVQPLVREIGRYRETAVYYQTYVSLTQQDIKRIDLHTVIAEQGKQAASSKEEIISEATYIFEPSTWAVAAHLERSMTQIALSQVILDSKLAQYASRFRAMSVAKDKATELHDETVLTYNRIKRSIQDERLKEMINGIRSTR